MATPLPPESESDRTSSPSSPVAVRPTRFRLRIALLALGLLVGGTAGGAVGGAVVASQHRPAAATAGTSAAGSSTTGTSPAAIYREASPGVVTISTELGSTFRNFREATGSGVVIDTQGDILTNQHVVANARQVRVTFSDGQTVNGTVAGVDASDDLAVVRVSVSESRLHPLALGNSDSVQIGDSVLAIGTPFGLQESLTSGIVSGLNRSSEAPNGRALTGLIQTDAAINPGNSGGPLLNARGEVIGVNESIQSPVQGSVGVGFAVPINTAKRTLPALEKGQAVQHPWLGISGQAITPALADSLGLSRQSGVLVVEVVAAGPADRAGLKATGTPDPSDDIITAIDGHGVTSVEDLTTYLNSRHVGDRVTLSIVRAGKPQSVEVTLGDFQQQSGS